MNDEHNCKEAACYHECKILTEGIPIALFITDLEGRYKCINEQWAALCGLSRTEAVGKSWFDYIDSQDQQKVRSQWLSASQNGHKLETDCHLILPDKSTLAIKTHVVMIADGPDGHTCCVGTVQETESQRLKQTEHFFNHLGHYDQLTGLPNRTLFQDRLLHAITQARRYDKKAAILFIDMDNFQGINDAFSHKSGDLLLRMLGERLQGALRESDTIARVGGDEFTVLIEGISQIEDVVPVVKKIMEAHKEPFELDSREIFITASVGVSLYPDHGCSPQVLLQSAGAAMYAAKDKGKNTYQFYTSQMAIKTLDRFLLGNQLRYALKRNELLLHYQPQIDSTSGDILGIEALLRWQHPERGLIPPGQFIPLAEESGLILPIGEWVLYKACQQNKEWQDKGLPPLRIAVNLSAYQVKQQNLVEIISQVLQETGLPADLLELEFSENIIFSYTEETIRLMQSLKELGVHLAIDDFGTGYTSLSYLTRFPFDTIKLDLSFARKITTYPTDAAIVSGVIAIANSLKMATIVEGVETGEQLAFFRERGCSQIQGWFFSPALPPDEFEEFCRGRLKGFAS